jgi:hypothetical protein
MRAAGLIGSLKRAKGSMLQPAADAACDGGGPNTKP